jgi:hypothetical protein
MSKAYVEPGKAALTGAVTSRKGASAYGEFYSDRRPDKDDDETQGYAEGSVWHYTDRQRVYLCVDPTEGAAVWRDLRDAAKVTIICRNNTGSTITKGSIVYVTGATGNHPTIALADKDSENTSSKTLGMVVADILTGADGSVAVNGTVDDLNTAAYAAGTPLYLGDNGGWTSPMPVSPAHSVFVGWVAISNANNGRIILHIQNGYELDELHDVLITTPTNGQVLAYESSTSLWKNVTPSSGGGVAVLGSFYTDESVTEDGADTWTVTIPAAKLGTNGASIRAKYTGTMSLANEGSVGVILGTTPLNGFAVTTTGTGEWEMETLVIRTGGTTARVVSRFLYEGSTDDIRFDHPDESAGFNWANSVTLKLSINAIDAGDTVTAKTGIVEFLPAP